jgi:hypothetical protein
MNIIRFEKIHEEKDVYVNYDMTEDNCFLRLCDSEQNPFPNIELIRTILKEGSILDCDNALNEMEFLENGHNDGYIILHCSFEESFSSSLLVFIKMVFKGEIERKGKTKFYINSNEENHSHTPHFHVKDGDNTFSFCFNGSQLAGEKPNGTISKKIKAFLNSPDTLEKLKKEWNKNNNNIQIE